MEERKIYLPGEQLFLSNSIRTCKYTALTFLPKNLWEQFQKLANVYFLVVAVLQCIPGISVSHGIPSILLPLAFVLTISAVKDAVEDYKRRKSDREENRRMTLKRQEGRWTAIEWRRVQVGDILKVVKNEFFPADLVLVASSEPKGVCSVETKNIDGETNLKLKTAPKDVPLPSEEALDSISAHVSCEPPDARIYDFKGLYVTESKVTPLAYDSFLLRGSSLKNTKWVVGIVVYTGHETKIMLNSSPGRKKFSGLELKMNREIIVICILQLILCTLCAVFSTIWLKENQDDTKQYLEMQDEYLGEYFVLQFFTWLLIFTNFVPISLIVTLEVVKFLQGYFISIDLDLYYEHKDLPAMVTSSNLNEELGQIQYVFTDKTGTLTCNCMEFRKFSVQGRVYGTDERMTLGKPEHVDFVDSTFNPQAPEVQDLLMHFACCHSVVVEESGDDISYNASSPDELALISGATLFGVKFIGRDAEDIEIETRGVKAKVKVLNVFDFSSKRKRMSVIVRLPDGTIRLLCKGADSKLERRLVPSAYKEVTWRHLEEFASIGLRTLVLAQKDIDERTYAEWVVRYEEAVNRIQGREEAVSKVCKQLEEDLELVGATAIEDRLQDGVPETVAALREAGVKVWMLTGDKEETAINIAFACRLLDTEMRVFTIKSKESETVVSQLTKTLVEIDRERGREFCLVIGDKALLDGLKDSARHELMAVAESCAAVIACRSSPQQKAELVHLVRQEKPEAFTLSIGDGANDVNMIIAAHVGIGISGEEGQQAARAADYSIGQFRFLRRLMFVHGRECYRRNSYLICYNFYKNVLYVMPLFWLGFFSAFSGLLYYNMWTSNLFNMFYAALPIMLYALFDREKPLHVIEASPKAYELGLKGLLFNSTRFWLWILEAFLQALGVFLLTHFSVCWCTGDVYNGRLENLWVAGMLAYGLVVVVVNLKILTFSYSYYWFTFFAIFLGIGTYLVTSIALSEWLEPAEWLDNYEARGAVTRLLRSNNTYLVLGATVVGAFLHLPVISVYYDLWQRRHEPQKKDEDEEEIERLLAQPSPMYERKHTGFAFSGGANPSNDPTYLMP
jgi:phospholipid-transporting ATPase